MTNDLVSQWRRVHRRRGDEFKDFTPLDLLYAEGSPLDTLLSSYLLWPEFVEFEGLVLLKRVMEDEEDRLRVIDAQTRMSAKEVEQSFNYVDLSDLFGRRGAEISESQEVSLILRMSEMWEAKLAREFCGRKFVVEVFRPSEEQEFAGLRFSRAD